MAQLFDIKKVTVGSRTLKAEVEVAASAPLYTSDDPEGTQLMLELIPQIADHVCLGDAGPHFGEVIESTELAHLLEHVAVELLARTNAAGDISTGRTTQTGERTFEVELLCPDDVLVAGALSSAVWIMQWAYSGGGDPKPDVDAIASGLVDLVASVSESQEDEPEPEQAPEPAAVDGLVGEKTTESEDDPAKPEPAEEQPQLQFAPEPEPEPAAQLQQDELFNGQAEAQPQPAAEPAASSDANPQNGWSIYNGPRPKSVR